MNKFIEVSWRDACSTEFDDDSIKHLAEIHRGENLMPINTTYGKLLKVLDTCVIIATEESTAGKTEVTIIPRNWIITPKKLKIK